MRTIKDPKKKPELRRRVEPLEEPEEDDNQSMKSTPPKKRKTTKSSKDDSSSFNDSGSFIDNQSDIVSEKSSVIGEEDMSDVSSLKSTPPKKRNYSRVVHKSPEVNTEINGDVHQPLENTVVEKKPKGKKKNKSGDSVNKPEKSPGKQEPEKKSPKSKKASPKLSQAIESKEKTTLKPVSETKKKSSVNKKKDKTGEIPDETKTSPKTKPGRKRKLSGPQGDTGILETPKPKEPITKSKPTKKAKKLSKTEEQNELKRQTEELRSDKSIAKDSKNEDIENKVKPKLKKSPPKKTVVDAVKASTEEHRPIVTTVNQDKSNEKVENKIQNPKHVSDSESDMDGDNSDDSSDLETSFDSINSHREEENVNENKLDDEEEKVDWKDKENEGAVNKGELSIKCDQCGYVSRSKGGHTRHLRKCQPEKFGLEVESQSKPKVHQCEQCEYTAPKRVLVINHMHSHGIYQCKRCKFRTEIEETLEEHCALEHKDRSDCKFCKKCNRYVKCSEVPLEKHMEDCQGRIPFKCPECSKEFQYESSLKCHVVSHYPEQPKLFSCGQCDYKSNYKANLKKHIRHIHEQRGERNIKCIECEKMFFTEDNMRRHLKLHSEERPYKCKENACDKAFKTMNGLKLHVISHQTDRPFPCDFDGCAKSFKTKRSLVLHLNETHQNAPKNFKCQEEGCDMAFYKKCHLERHTDAHKDNRTHFCTFITCTKAFRTAESLKVHSMFHLDLKPLKCEHCEYTCRQKSSIKFHMKKKHPELVPNDLKSPQPSSTPNKTSEETPGENSAETDSIIPKSECIENVRVKDDIDDVENDSPSDSESFHHANQTSLISTSEPNIDRNLAIRTQKGSSGIVPLESDAPEDTAVVTNQNRSDSTEKEMKPSISANEIAPKNFLTNELPPRKVKKTDMYEFQSEEESGDEMKPGLLRKGFDKDKPPLPSVDTSLLADREIPDTNNTERADEVEKPKKERKKPGPKPKPKPEKVEEEKLNEPKVAKKRGRKKKSETEKQTDKPVELDTEIKSPKKSEKIEAEKEKEKPKSGKRGRSPKGKKGKEPKPKVVEEADDDEEEEKKVPVKKKRGPKIKKKVKEPSKKEVKVEKVEKVPKKRGRKSKAEKLAAMEKAIEPENGDATINYSEVESSELFGDSKDSMPDKFNISDKSPDKFNISDKSEKSENVSEPVKEIEMNFSEIRPESDVSKSDSEDESTAKVKTSLPVYEKLVEEKKISDSESSDIGSDFDEDLKPPPAPRPPPMYDSEDGDIESGPENEDFNTSAMSNEPLRDFESSREISREISRDFESSREIDDSVKTNEYINSVETSTPKENIGTPVSVNPYKIDSVNNEHENPQSIHSHHSSVPHTPSHNSVPTTPAAHELQESRSIEQQPTGDRIIKNPVHGQTNEENTDESSMPEVDKDYVGRFFEEIQCTQVQPESQISRINSIDENSKSQDKIVEAPRSDSGVPSSLNSNQTEGSMQIQSPPTDLSHKRIDLISPERPPEPHYQPRSESVHNRSSERIPSVPSFDTQYPHNPIDPYSPTIPSRDTILRQTEQTKPPSPPNSTPSFMRFPDSEAMLQRQRMPTPYDRNLQNLHRIAEAPLSQHNSSSPLLRHVPGRDEVFPGTAGVTGSMARNPFHSSWAGQDVRPAHWGHPTYLQQQSGSASSALFGKDTYLPGREFMFDPSRAAERNMFSSLAAPSHTQRPEIPHDTFQFERFDLGSYLSYNTPPSLPVDYTRSAHSSSQKSLDERYRQSGPGVSEYRTLPPTSSASDMFGVNSSFNLEKFYSRDPMYHSQHITDNTSNPFLPGVPTQHAMFSRDYPHSRFYTQNPAYPFMNMNEKNYSSSTSSKLGHTSDPVGQQRDLVPVPRPNMAAPDSQLQDPYRYNSSMLYNMMNKYF